MADVREVMARYLPSHRDESVVLLGRGTDHVAYEVNGELIVRFGGDAVAEASLLRTVASISPIPVPVPVFVAPELGCLAYQKLPGVPLIDVPLAARSVFAPALGEFLSALHTAHVETVPTDDFPPSEWLAEARRHYETLPARFHSPVAETFLRDEPPRPGETKVFSHNDLGIEHVLVENGAITGIIDWSDAAITDPAYDFGLIYRDLGPAALTGIAELRERAVFYARCTVFEDLAYGLQTEQSRYVDKCVASMEWLF